MSTGSGTLVLSEAVRDGDVWFETISRDVTGEGSPFLVFEFREVRVEQSPEGELWEKYCI